MSKDLGPTDMTPAGLTSPEKIKRTNKAVKARQEAASDLLGSLLPAVLDDHGDLSPAMKRLNINPEYVDLLRKLQKTYEETHDEFLRALSDNPPRS